MELQQALRRIGRDDIVHKMNKYDMDSEGDSLRLVDSSNLNLNRSDFSSKGSLGISEKNPSAASDPGNFFNLLINSTNCFLYYFNVNCDCILSSSCGGGIST